MEVHSLLDKVSSWTNCFSWTDQWQFIHRVPFSLRQLQPHMITLDPTVVGKVDRASKEVIAKQKQEEYDEAHPKEQIQLRNKARGKNSSLRRFLRKKQRNVIDQKKVTAGFHNLICTRVHTFNLPKPFSLMHRPNLKRRSSFESSEQEVKLRMVIDHLQLWTSLLARKQRSIKHLLSLHFQTTPFPFVPFRIGIVHYWATHTSKNTIVLRAVSMVWRIKNHKLYYILFYSECVGGRRRR